MSLEGYYTSFYVHTLSRYQWPVLWAHRPRETALPDGKFHLCDLVGSQHVSQVAAKLTPCWGVPAANDAQHGPESPRSPGLKSRGSTKLPKLPMVRKGSKWYRGRLLRDSGARVFIGTIP